MKLRPIFGFGLVHFDLNPLVESWPFPRIRSKFVKFKILIFKLSQTEWIPAKILNFHRFFGAYLPPNTCDLFRLETDLLVEKSLNLSGRATTRV